MYKCQNSPVQQAPNQTSHLQSPQFQAPQYQDVPPARPEPPVTLTSGNDPNFPAPPSSRDSYTLPNVTTNIAETSKFKITFISLIAFYSKDWMFNIPHIPTTFELENQKTNK